MRHVNIPIFIPHLGCPNQCIFCNQRHISGKVEFREADVEGQINQVLSTVSNDDFCEIAFFGGSFTGIDKNLMIRLLDTAQKYVNLGKVNGIRMSTRPDYISDDVIDILKKYAISYVELGVQTMSDKVLSYIKRGHTVADTQNAVKLLNEAKIPFVGQMMIGLPYATIDDEIKCAEAICKFGASGSRIYPTLVFSNTDLETITKSGEYIPLSVDEAIKRSAIVLRVFYNNNVPCFRIGLCDSDNLHSSETYVAGPNEPSIGEMVKSRMYFDIIAEEILKQSKVLFGKCLIIECSKGKTSQVIGNKRKNILELKEHFNIKDIKVIENKSLVDFDIKIKVKEENLCV